MVTHRRILAWKSHGQRSLWGHREVDTAVESGSAVFFPLLTPLHQFLPALEVLLSAPSCERVALRPLGVQGAPSSFAGL